MTVLLPCNHAALSLRPACAFLGGATVFGVGYAIAGGASQRPNRSYILQGQQFAVHDDVPTQAAPAGLLWAYVNGTRDGHPYHYVATLPHIVTDVVDFCPNKGPSLYRLPWKANTLQAVTQAGAARRIPRRRNSAGKTVRTVLRTRPGV